ncbi:MAG TPA: hypothetical protein VHF69_00870 [Candidatus Synoicihabitans sp.]|nr:hypothetical protein [Candidatus Synoicihabitans sp.]
MTNTLRKLRSPRAWVYGLFASIIGGSANAFIVVMVDPLKFNLGSGLADLLKVAVASGLFSAALYLKQSPLPPVAEAEEDRGNGGLVPMFAATCLTFMVFGFTGCATTGGAERITPELADLVAGITQPVTKNLVLPLLANNPEYEPVLLAIAAGVDVIFAKGTISAAEIKEYVDALSLKFELDDQAKLLIGSALFDVWQVYAATYGDKVAVTTDPNVVKILTAFRRGILDGIEFYHAFHPSR